MVSILILCQGYRYRNDSEQIRIVFERFGRKRDYCRDYEGSGLGLSISKAYVEMLGGRIWVESQVDKGSVFYFTIKG